ncbi:MAG: FHA domain-containing protein [Propionibacteriaceae bacterium]|jgi:S-DNA-T family DNA segregation ATPase FtsK/SpoIIIE|nr:FHA domain-containing protein [Propionibacteriaceae bacterium]
MKLKLTYIRPEGHRSDVQVTCDSTTTVGGLADYLRAADPQPSAAVPPEGLTVCLPEEDNRVLPSELTVSESGLRSGQRVALARAGAQYVGPGAAAAVLSVIGGPDQGRDFALLSGSNVVGRGRDCQVQLSDPLVSRNHIRINLVDQAEVIDLGSANGVAVGGRLIDRQVLRPGDVVELGETRLTVQLTHRMGVEGRVEGSSVGFIRSPRLVKPYLGRKFPVPEIPVPSDKSRFPAAMMLAMMAMGGSMFLMSRQLSSLVFVAIMPLMIVGTWLEERLGAKAKYKAALKQWRADVDDLVREADQEAEVEIAARHIEHPATAECAQAAVRRSNLLWTRRTDAPGFAELRLGAGQLPSRNVLEWPDLKKAPRASQHELRQKLAHLGLVAPVPVVCQFTQRGGLGLAGPRAAALPLARAMVAQAVSLHSPTELALTVLASSDSSPDWDWVKWLPHTGSGVLGAQPLAGSVATAAGVVGELEELIEGRAGQQRRDGAIPTPVLLVVVESDAPVEFGRLTELVEKGWSQGVYVLWVAPDLTQLPASCRVYVDLRDAASGAVGYLHEGDLVTPVALDRFEFDPTDWARLLAPVVDLTARSDDATDVPRMTSYVGIVGPEVLSQPHAIIERWNANQSLVSGPYAPSPPPRKAATLRAAIGQSAVGLHSLDLRADGPHALVGGTTGSGKSELLQTWVLAMAANHSAQRLNFLLVDYKGGSAFAECSELPHTVGMVTDLNAAGVNRALASLSAELTFREHLLGSKKAKDLVALEKSSPVDAPPTLIIIVDEFAALVQEVPEFVDGVVNVAQRGRSLGLHLILATQRPAGVIKDNLRANTNLRLALRVADIDDSNDVLGSPQAAYFDQDVPGRAMSKTGPGRLVTFQTAYVGGHTGDQAPPPDIKVETLGFGASQVWETPAEDDPKPKVEGESDLKRIVRTIQQAHQTAELPLPRKPWLPDLRTYYNLADPEQVPSPRTDEQLVFGVSDDPDRQTQPPVSYWPDQVGNLAIYGAGGSGKSTMLRALAVAAGMTYHGGPCHVFGLDFSSRGLAMLEDLPHVGSVVPAADSERVERLLRWLRDTIDERVVRYSEANAATITEYRGLAQRPDEPRIVLLLDGLTAFRQAYDASDKFRFWDLFLSIAADGRPTGVHVALTCDQVNGVPPALDAAIQQRVVMRMSTVEDYPSLGVSKDILTPASPPGRCIVNGLEAQVGVLGGDPAKERAAQRAAERSRLANKGAGELRGHEFIPPTDARSQATNIALYAQAMRRSGLAEAPPIRRLAEEVPRSSLRAAPGHFALGLESADFETVQVSVAGPFVLAGPPGSGLSTALATIVEGLAECPGIGAIHLFSDRPTNLARRPGLTAVTIGSLDAAEPLTALQDEIQALAPDDPRVAILVEGLPDYAGSDAEFALESLFQAAARGGHFILVSGEPAGLSQAYSLMNVFKSGRRAMLLQFDSDNPELVQAVYPRARAIDFPEGRGVYAERGRSRIVQVALPDQPL